MADADFDDVYSFEVRSVSGLYWTPVAVARRAAELLVIRPHARVLDIGSGAGKFCLVGAASTDATFVGIEQREHLVRTAEIAQLRLGVDRASFVHGRFDKIDIHQFDALYFYNPFEENVWWTDRLDDTVELSHERFADDVGRAEALLDTARVGTRVVTYHGFGGAMPPSYRLERREPNGSGELALWVKADARTREEH